MLNKLKHIALLGDSILDNGSYVHYRGGKDVSEHLKQKTSVPVSLIAVDGSVIENVYRNQIYRIPPDVSHIVVSVGGNDVLRAKSILFQRVNNLQTAFASLGSYVEKFKQEYQHMMQELTYKMPDKNIILCTIYNPNYDDEALQKVCMIGVTVFNDIILSEAMKYGLPVIDLRSMFNEKEDYANPIEPSHQGGLKIANAVHRVTQEHNFDTKKTVLYNK